MDSAQLRRLAKCCTDMAALAADGDGFIAVHRLSEVFRADIECRPLLVEGMIARPKGSGGKDANTLKWKVLIDKDTFGITSEKLASESLTKPLPERFRFTVAHELAHTLSFRASEFGVELEQRKSRRESTQSFVEKLESETNELAPLLLISEAAIQSECEKQEAGIGLAGFCAARNRWAISRSVLISRLNLLRLVDGLNLRLRHSLSNMILGVGEWRSASSATLSQWPLHVNFGDNLVPEFVTRLLNKGSCGLSEIAPLDAIQLGEDGVFRHEIESFVGTSSHPEAEKGLIKFSFENTPRKSGQPFLFMVNPG